MLHVSVSSCGGKKQTTGTGNKQKKKKNTPSFAPKPYKNTYCQLHTGLYSNCLVIARFNESADLTAS